MTFNEFLTKHLIWLVTLIFAIGCFCAAVKFQEQSLAEVIIDSKLQSKQITTLEKDIVRLDSIALDIQEIKIDVKEIRKILYKPAISKNEYDFDRIGSR